MKTIDPCRGSGKKGVVHRIIKPKISLGTGTGLGKDFLLHM
jgi:hypothetical protein